MVKKSKKNPQYNGIIFDSSQQVSFYKWCEVASQNGIITQFVYQPQSFVLSESQRYNGACILRPHKYTCDFKIVVNPQFYNKLKCIFKHNVNDFTFYIDTKGKFNKNESHTKLSIQTKWVYQKYGILIHKVYIQDTFLLTFIPQQQRYTPVRKQIKEKYISCIGVKQFKNKKDPQ